MGSRDLNGGWILCCQREDRKLRRMAKESMGARVKKRLLTKSPWYKGAWSSNRGNYDNRANMWYQEQYCLWS